MPTGLDLVRASVAVFVTLTGTTLGLTWLFMGMRSVMEVGGACAEGGAFEIAVPCPKGVPLLVTGGLLGGGVMCAMYAWKVSKYHIPSFLAFAWPALFLSLGWNFLEFGLNPPGPETGLVWGWLVCAIVFGLMGGLPLLATIKPVFKRFAGATSEEAWKTKSSVGLVRARARARSMRSAGEGGDLVTELERLNAMHESGALDDDEFEAAKRRVLTEDPGS